MMNNYDSKSKLKEITSNSHYLRVDEKHPLELLIGLNDLGQKTIRFIGDFLRIKVKGTRAIEINHYEYHKKFIISFSLIDLEYTDLFYLFCNDLIDSSRKVNQKDGYVFLVNRFEKWRGFGGSTKRYLSESEIKGLIGELLFLKDELFEKYGISNSILGWTGPEPTNKDFSFDDVWFEVKSVTKNVISISSIEQLDSDTTGYLILYYLEKMSPLANGYDLNNIVDSILSLIKIDTDRSLFIMKLINVGYFKEEYYNSFVYKISNKELYEVDEKFPKLKRNSLPKAVLNVKYDLIINMLDNFRREKL